MNEHDLYQEACKVFGREHQLMKAVEELAELQVAICKLDVKINGSSREQVIDELVDVYIMLEQVKLITNISTEELKIRKDFKLARLKQYIDKTVTM